MKAPDFWYKAPNESPFWLKPLSWLYWLASHFRHLWAVPLEPEIPVICVGNIVMGGGGKTPMALYLYEKLKPKFSNIAILSRGYGGKQRGPVFVDKEAHTALDVGDEPLLFARHNCTVIVAKNKKAGVEYAQDQGVDCLIMDDGYQNPHVFKTIHILMVDSRGFGNGHQFPAGPLRELIPSALAKANFIITRGKLSNKNDIQAIKAASKPVYPMAYTVDKTPNPNHKYLAFAGIADPEKFHDTLKKKNIDVVEFIPYGDHHAYTAEDFNTLQSKATQHGAKLITTEKDFVRFTKDQQKHLNIVEINAQIKNEDQFLEEISALLGI